MTHDDLPDQATALRHNPAMAPAEPLTRLRALFGTDDPQEVIREITDRDIQLAAFRKKMFEDELRLQEAQTELDATRQQLEAHRHELETTRQALDEVLHSTSWRLTFPLRKLAGAFRRK